MDKEAKQEKKQIKEEMREEKHIMFHRRNWLRHNAMVPKGFLRYHVLEALNEQPMSGSELMDQIGKHTDGAWKPSPGSIYPLLAWLQDNRYVKELPTENGFKRYELTQSGKDFFEEQTKIREKFSQNSGFLASPFFDRFFGNIPEEKSNQIRNSMRHLFVSSIKLGKSLRENYSEKELDDALKVLDEASAKLEEIRNRVKGEKSDE
ncbi:MAG: PadR family transcriptional regulator [Candidatus Bathyarchaeia archaeon]